MKRSWNGWLWAGFLVAAAGVISYIPVFARFPSTRDFPWVNLLLIALGLLMLGIGLVRAFGRPKRYRGRIFGTGLALLAVAGAGMFCWVVFYAARQLPVSASAPRVGQKAPEFELPDQDGRPVSLAQLLSNPTTAPSQTSNKGGALLIFYRGYW